MINEPKLLTIRKGFARPEADHVIRLGEATTCWIGDAMGGRGALDAAIKPIIMTTKRLAGTAITVDATANSNAAIFAAIECAQKGDIILANVEAFEGAAVVGDVLAGMAKNKGIAAIVVDGMVRDIEGLREVGLTIWARGLTPNSCSKDGIARIGTEAIVGGILVRSGDIVVIDEDGVIPVRSTEAANIIERIDAIKVAEKAVLAKVAQGATLPPSMEALLNSDRVEFID